MLFNFGKCKCLHSGHANEDAQYTMGDTVLNITVKEKDLGLTISVYEVFKLELSRKGKTQFFLLIRQNILSKKRTNNTRTKQ
ncbi:hypothetical protein NP493_265g01001 [Ridgeia piscesae]|uniref:Uncharacterized protein n=1 Tax=Ridgeia piscesae TaxID=27915 RepID=A0AAD9NXU9_RIDPI|nr:hypothetical protein NP493_265g01001 [Ridgeia piscesae]